MRPALPLVAAAAVVGVACLAAKAEGDQAWRKLIGTGDGVCTRTLTPDGDHWYFDCGENASRCGRGQRAVRAPIAALRDAQACGRLRSAAIAQMCVGYDAGVRGRCEEHVRRVVSSHCGDTLRLGAESVCVPAFDRRKAPDATRKPAPAPSTGTAPIGGACSYVGTC